MQAERRVDDPPAFACRGELEGAPVLAPVGDPGAAPVNRREGIGEIDALGRLQPGRERRALEGRGAGNGGRRGPHEVARHATKPDWLLIDGPLAVGSVDGVTSSGTRSGGQAWRGFLTI